MVKKKNVVLPPELPPDVPEEEVVFSDEDVQFVAENIDYAGLLSNLDTKSITKHVNRVADVKEDALESLYERRHKRKSVEIEKNVIEVDPVDALPVKTLDGELYYKTIPKLPPKVLEGESGKENDDDWTEKSVVKLTKAEKRAKNKKERKEAKKQGKEGAEVEQNQLASQADVLDEVKKDLTAEETKEQKMYRLAELGTALLAEPETNIKSIREMLDISKDENPEVVTLALKSLLAVFRDIIPGYRIRLPTEKEMEMKVSRIVKKLRLFESTLLSSYKAYVQKLVALEEKPMYKRVAVRCLSTLLEAVPHFNFRQEVLAGVVRHLSSQDDILRKCCCAAVKYIFTNEGKHGGEATLEAVKLIADLVKSHDCQLHPDSIEVLMSLVFDEDLGKSKTADQDYKHKNKKFKKGKDGEEKTKLSNNERKKARQESVSKTREEVEADFRSASLGKDAAESRKIQSETLSAVFQIFFRVLRQTLHASSLQGASDSHPLLAPSLNGIGKFSHLIDLDFMADLMNYLRKLAGGAANSSGSENSSKQLTVTERLQCCIVAFKVMKSNLDALNIDLQDFYVQLYTLILEYRPGRDQGEVLAEALKIMLCDERQHDMQRAAAFIKRLATFSLCFGSAESMAALVTLKHLLQKNVKCRNLLENDIGGGSVSGGIAKYQPYASDPHISGALASVLWELNLLSKHYHPSVSTISSNISTMSAADNQVLYSTLSPQQAFAELSLEQELSKPTTDSSIGKKKKASKSGMPATFKVNTDMVDQIDENEVRKKLSEHFVVLRDISENEKLRAELELTSRSLQLYEQYKKQKKRKTKAR